jgi:hypothetical protein
MQINKPSCTHEVQMKMKARRASLQSLGNLDCIQHTPHLLQRFDFDLTDAFGRHLELGLQVVQLRKSWLHAAQIEKQLALTLGGGNSYQSPIADNEFMDSRP